MWVTIYARKWAAQERANVHVFTLLTKVLPQDWTVHTRKITMGPIAPKIPQIVSDDSRQVPPS